ncbi:MAG: hypothetical protein M3N95_10795 [Actinomycetota bacterium]|nr:hypothetical protein [Actinomycetota bacterium]
MNDRTEEAGVTTIGRQTVPPVTCHPFCQYQDGHPDCVDDVDQVCYGVELKTDLSLEYPGPDYVTVFGARAHGIDNDEGPMVHLARNDLQGFDMTPGEARQVIEHLQLVLGQIS